MKLFKLFPSVRPVTPVHLLLFGLFSFLLTAGAATDGYGQTLSARPVARLIGASQPASSPRNPVILSTASRAHAVASPANLSVESLARRAFDLINEQRQANGEVPLVWDEGAGRMAQVHSQNMAERKFMSHIGTDGRDVDDRARDYGVRWSALAENVAYNQGFDDPAGFAVERWMKSSKHRDNALNAEFTRSAIGVARAADGSVYFTQVFLAR